MMSPEHSLAAPTSQDLANQIEQIIRNRTGGSVYGLQVDVNEESVILSGRTSTFYNKQLATLAAQSAANGRLLSNEIEVS